MRCALATAGLDHFHTSIYLVTIAAVIDSARASAVNIQSAMHPSLNRFGAELLLSAGLAIASGVAAASDDAVDLAAQRAGARSDGFAFGMPVPEDFLLATFAGTPSSGPGFKHPDGAPAVAQSGAASSRPSAFSAPARMTVSAPDGGGPSGLNATVSIILTSTSMSDAAARAVPRAAMSGVVSVVSVGCSVR